MHIASLQNTWEKKMSDRVWFYKTEDASDKGFRIGIFYDYDENEMDVKFCNMSIEQLYGVLSRIVIPSVINRIKKETGDINPIWDYSNLN